MGVHAQHGTVDGVSPAGFAGKNWIILCNS